MTPANEEMLEIANDCTAAHKKLSTAENDLISLASKRLMSNITLSNKMEDSIFDIWNKINRLNKEAQNV